MYCFSLEHCGRYTLCHRLFDIIVFTCTHTRTHSHTGEMGSVASRWCEVKCFSVHVTIGSKSVLSVRAVGHESSMAHRAHVCIYAREFGCENGSQSERNKIQRVSDGMLMYENKISCVHLAKVHISGNNSKSNTLSSLACLRSATGRERERDFPCIKIRTQMLCLRNRFTEEKKSETLSFGSLFLFRGVQFNGSKLTNTPSPGED